MLEEGLYSYLSTHPDLTPHFAARIYPQLIPQHVYDEATKLPCLVYQRITTQRQVKFCNTDDLARASMQIDSYSRKYLTTKQVARELYNALLDYRGFMGSVDVRACQQESEFDLLDIEPGLYRVSQIWAIWYVET